jgi:glycosyltransferase involved in cell wall biosynthesis
MRVLFLTEECISFSGSLVRGGAIHVRNVVSGLRDRGHEVFLLDWNSDPGRPFQISLSPRSRFVEGPLRTTFRAIRVGHRQEIDVVVSKTRKTYLPGLVAARRLGVPHVIHVGSSLDPPIESLSAKLDLASFVARLRAPHDAYFVVCDYISDQLRERGVDTNRIFDIRNAVDTDRFHPAAIPVELDARFRDQIRALDGRFRLGFIGGLQSYKGLDDLAVALDETTVEWDLVVAGDGPERARLERLFGARSAFLGSVPYEQIPALYHELDVFVLPSHTEGLPRVILEAQATGTPTIATRVGGVPEVIEDGKTGVLCNSRQPVALRRAIERLATDEAGRERLGHNGRKFVAESFSWERMYDRYETYLSEVVE